jgi:dolichol-phosphate mannosyltransferase
MIELSVVIPVYNESLNIHKLYQRLKLVANSISPAHEFIFVNDGSKDNTLELVKELAAQDPAVRYISLSRNFGHQIAVMAGLDNTLGEAIVIIDADLQDPPELINEMYAKLKSGYEVVYAKRKKREGESFMKLFTAKLFYRILSSITSINIPVDTGDFRIIHKKVVEVLRKMPEQNKFLRGQISWIGFRQTYVEYSRAERAGGKTGYTYRKMIRFALDGITSFSDFPLKLSTFLGFTVSIITFFVGIYALYGKFVLKNSVPGWASIMISVLFLGGVQLITIGIIGEYISRINTNVKQRPLYVIDENNLSKT